MEQLAPGMRVEIRDAEWRIRQVDRSSDGGEVLTCEGVSELVRGRRARFLTRLEHRVRVLDPRETELVEDASSGYQAGRLYIDTVIRKTPTSSERICLGHRAALDPLPFQLEPALQALSQPRPRILIADAVGLGKTLEAGILASELISRGQGKRILVLAVKSMLAQFQQEFWNRFTIPLVRLDSTGLQRVRNRIPSNHNPFHYFDRAIISIDTLKQDIEYRHYLEQAYWDLIIIDEAHNVADRGSRSQRARLAKLLSTRSDALVMLSATPHDGKAESFASLVNMLDPTAIANPRDYAHEDFRDKGLVIRRFKKDVQDQLGTHLPEREIGVVRAGATQAEERAYSALDQLELKSQTGSRGVGGLQLFTTTLKKTLYSSPAACLATIDNRIRNLEKRGGDEQAVRADVDALSRLREVVSAIDAEDFSKYQYLLRMLGTGADSLGWNPKDPADRLVIFTESIRTLEFLERQLAQDLKLRKGALRVLRGDAPDRELMETVDAFGRRDEPVRLLLCSDVAAEGLNLHHLSYRLIHFDVPWSLMVFQQRNGRIDRYGQTRPPQIRYLVTDPGNARIQGEQRVLEVLIEKDQQASRNIGDPSEFMGVHSVEEEEAQVGAYIESGDDDMAGLFSAFLDNQQEASESPLDAFVPQETRAPSLEAVTEAPITLFEDDFDYARTAVQWLHNHQPDLQAEADPQRRVLTLTAPQDLRQRLRHIAPQARPEGDRFILTPDVEAIQQELDRRRDEDSPWASRQYLWPLHPVMEWLADRAENAFGRHAAPVFRLPRALEADETAFLLQGGFPNRRGYPVVHGWLGVRLREGAIVEEYGLQPLIEALGLRAGALPNRGESGDTEALKKQLPDVVDRTEAYLQQLRREQEPGIDARLNRQMESMDALKQHHIEQMELELAASREVESKKARRRAEREQHIERVFRDYENWLRDTQMMEQHPYVQVVAAFTGAEV
ncbi:DEAD/DEAH box helicase [Halorhodospira halophila]|uniref:DEAD/DEAH box helicase n=1 Tax=Halorhodospira halophila TaxID=1053 RepID=UPI001F5D52D4|nr:DEAD/DEAH box helicase [Halorhodospira halophila]